MWFPFNFAKNLKDHHFLVGGSKNMKLSPNTCFGVSFQKNVLSSQIFRNNKPLPKYLTDRKLKMSVVFIFEIKDAKKDKIFKFLKFLRNRCPYGYDFWLVFRYLCEASKKYNFAIFFKI